MIKNSTELIKACKEALEKMLSRCLDMGVQPSYYEMYQRGYGDGISDAAEGVPEDLRTLDQWHWVETEGVPDNDDTHWLLYEYDGKYRDTTHGYYEDGRWHLDYHPSNCDYKVLAWHPLPKVASFD